jgi:hypothetical protein
MDSGMVVVRNGKKEDAASWLVRCGALRSRHVILEWILLGLSDSNTRQLCDSCPGLPKDLDMAILCTIISITTTTTVTSSPTMLSNSQLDVVVGSSDDLSGIRDGLKGGRAVSDHGGADVSRLDLARELNEDALEFWVGFGKRVLSVDGLGFADASEHRGSSFC